MELELDIRKTLRSGKRVFQLQVAFSSSAQRMVLLGPSGSGKSQTLKAIAGLVKPDSGFIRLNGRTLFDAKARVNLSPQNRKMAYLFQDYALFPHLTVRQNIGFGMRQGWLNPGADEQHERIDYWLKAFDLQHLAHQFPSDISGGQRQRTALARALVMQPHALLLDEPFAALDPALRVKMRHELDDLQQSLQVPMILITHDPQDAEVFGEQVLTLREGAVECDESHLGMALAAAC